MKRKIKFQIVFFFSFSYIEINFKDKKKEMKIIKKSQNYSPGSITKRPIIIQETYDLKKLRTINLNTINDRFESLVRYVRIMNIILTYKLL